MAYTGQTISNPFTGERITFLETTEDTGGERLLFDCRVSPNGTPLPPHIHARQDERLEVLGGTLGVMVGDNAYVLRQGQHVALPTQIKHQWWNAGRDELYLRVKAAPARHLELVLEAISGMALDGKVGANGMPRNPFDLAQLLRLSETYTPLVPIWMQRLALSMGVSIGWLLGHEQALMRYRTEPGEFLQVDGNRPDAA
jgi:mannose-6-phosphate isomerase-like protein (cupin superfamily)